jgi:hypothetical protein
VLYLINRVFLFDPAERETYQDSREKRPIKKILGKYLLFQLTYCHVSEPEHNSSVALQGWRYTIPRFVLLRVICGAAPVPFSAGAVIWRVGVGMNPEPFEDSYPPDGEIVLLLLRSCPMHPQNNTINPRIRGMNHFRHPSTFIPDEYFFLNQ